jgi:hypothetical protein
MRTFVMSLSAVAAFSILNATPGFAQYEGPWCLHTIIGPGSVADYCDMRSYEMCRARMTYSGSHCAPNPRFGLHVAEKPRSKRKVKRTY